MSELQSDPLSHHELLTKVADKVGPGQAFGLSTVDQIILNANNRIAQLDKELEFAKTTWLRLMWYSRLFPRGELRNDLLYPPPILRKENGGIVDRVVFSLGFIDRLIFNHEIQLDLITTKQELPSPTLIGQVPVGTQGVPPPAAPPIIVTSGPVQSKKTGILDTIFRKTEKRSPTSLLGFSEEVDSKIHGAKQLSGLLNMLTNFLIASYDVCSLNFGDAGIYWDQSQELARILQPLHAQVIPAVIGSGYAMIESENRKAENLAKQVLEASSNMPYYGIVPVRQRAPDISTPDREE